MLVCVFEKLSQDRIFCLVVGHFVIEMTSAYEMMKVNFLMRYDPQAEWAQVSFNSVGYRTSSAFGAELHFFCNHQPKQAQA